MARRFRLCVAVLTCTIAACTGRGPTGGPSTNPRDIVFPDAESAARIDLDRLRQGQQRVADCMASAGFDYVPMEPAVGNGAPDWFVGDKPGSFVEKYGYGKSIPIAPQDDPRRGVPDPNYDHVMALSPGERAAWDLALAGPDGSSGCLATASALPESGDMETLFLDAFEQELAEMQQHVYADPRIDDGDQSWVDCMAEQGFHFQGPVLATRMIDERLAALDASDQRELKALQDLERRVAIADLSCPFNNFGGWQLAYEEVFAEYEDRFYDEHEAAIIALLEGTAPPR